MDKLTIATRRVDEAERAEAEERAITLKLARAHIQDMAIELQFFGLKHRTTTPETVEFQDRILQAYSDFIDASKARATARDYVTPATQVASVSEVSAALAMLPGSASELAEGELRMIAQGEAA